MDFLFQLVTSIPFERKTRKRHNEQHVENDHYGEVFEVVTNEVGVQYFEKQYRVH